MNPKSLTLALICSAILLAGCGGPQNPATYPVTGKVTLKGKPVAGASVVFVPQNATEPGATATSQDDGTYSLTTYVNGDGARPGSYNVRVAKYEMIAEPPGTTDELATLDEEEESYDPTAEARIAEAKNELPSKYQDELKSGLAHTVVDKPTVYEITLD